MRLDPDLTPAEQQEVRGGLVVGVPVTSSVPLVGTITTSPVQMQAVADGGGPSYITTEFDPVSGGTTTLAAVTPAAFDTPNIASNEYYYHTELTAVVSAPRICLSIAGCTSLDNVQVRVGEDLQVGPQLYLESAPSAPVTITATSANGSVVQVSSNETGAGAVSATVPNVANTAFQSFWLHGLTQGQSTQVTLSAPGYQDTVVNVTVDPR